MIKRCIVCEKSFGEIEPLENKDYTDGYCFECFQEALQKVVERRIDRLAVVSEEEP